MLDARLIDGINGGFELVGAIATWANARRLWRDRTVSGVDWRSMGFFSVWGLWNLIYYPNLNQWASTLGGAALVVGNLAWLAMYFTFQRKKSERL